MAVHPTLSYGEITKMRFAFEKRLFQTVKSRRHTCYEWRKREWIQNTIKSIEAYNQEPDKELPDKVTDLLNNYNVTEDGGEKKLRMNFDFQIVAMEDYFDVIYDAHINTAHGSRCEMHEHLKKLHIYIPLKALQFFLNLCEPCKTQKSETDKSAPTQHRGFVEVLDMCDNPDGQYKYILHYRDVTTDCRFLRAMRSSNVVEIAAELLTLFLLIGCPGILHTPVTPSFTDSIIERLMLAWPDCLILGGKHMKSAKKVERIEERVRKWMAENSSSWSLGIYFVANEMNHSVYRNYKETMPLRKLLANEPDKGLLNSSKLKSVLKVVNFETDLKNIDYAEYSDTSESSEESERENEKVIPDKRECKEDQITKPEKIQENLPGPSNLYHYQLETETMANQDSDLQQWESVHVRQIPVKTYAKRAKLQEARVSQPPESSQLIENIKTKTQQERNSETKSKCYSKATFAKRAKLQTLPDEDETATEKVLCVDRNLKGIIPPDKMNKYQHKKHKLWNTQKIDLPHTLLNTNKLINMSEENFDCTDNFGAIARDIAVDPLKIGFIDVSTAENDNSNKQDLTGLDEKPDFGVIIKIESLASDDES